MIYLDNAATSFPKPPCVAEAMRDYTERVGAPVNRSAYGPAREAGLIALSLRERLKRLANFPGACSRVLLTSGATFALNQAIVGFLRPGDHCLVSAMEHNAVMRPLTRLAAAGVSFSRIPCDAEGRLRMDELEGLFRPETRMLVLAHASNVCGTAQDAEAVGAVCARRGAAFVLDAAQTAGHWPVDFARFRLSALVVPAHKGLLGPAGIGALLVTDDFAAAMTPLVAGGTGSASDSEDLPAFLPDRFEAGTPNLPGIYGWEAALGYVENVGVDALCRRQRELTARFLEGLAGVPGARVAGPRAPDGRVGVLSVDFPLLDNAEVAARLEEDYGVLTRCGLHCAPAAHRTLHTFPKGTVRFSTGYATADEDVNAAVAAIREIAKRG